MKNPNKTPTPEPTVFDIKLGENFMKKIENDEKK